jgi:predicted Fe-S protein YdhL (DUF1289 family)
MAGKSTELIASPCVNRCTLDARDICLGCRRSLDEICRWQRMCNDERREVLRRCHERALF